MCLLWRGAMSWPEPQPLLTLHWTEPPPCPDARHRGRGHERAPPLRRRRGRRARNRSPARRSATLGGRLRALPRALRAQPLRRRDARALRPPPRRARRMSLAPGGVSFTRLKRRALSIEALLGDPQRWAD